MSQAWNLSKKKKNPNIVLDCLSNIEYSVQNVTFLLTSLQTRANSECCVQFKDIDKTKTATETDQGTQNDYIGENWQSEEYLD